MLKLNSLILIILLASIGCRTKTVTRTVIHERIDTTITIAPDTLRWRSPIKEIRDRPQVFENDRSKTTVQIVRDTIQVETICKPDTVRVYLDRTIEQKQTERKPRRIIPWWVWYVAGILSVIIIRLTWK